MFAPLTHLSGINKEYIRGELNIFELMNFEQLDGVIVDSVSLIENNDLTIKNRLQEKLERECTKPVVSLSLPLGDYPVVESNDAPIFREIVEHVLDVHHIQDICFLTGHKDYKISEERLQIFKEVMEERGLTVKPEQIVYGDFWYSSGTKLAERILSGEIPKPGAVICASDHMAIGLARKLSENGVNIPKDMIITGFEATQEAALNDISITSFESNAEKAAADAVDIIRAQIDPDEKVIPFAVKKSHICAGRSCGCELDFYQTAKAFKDSFYCIFRDYELDDSRNNIDIGQLMEGYTAEVLAESETPAECMKNICWNTYFLRPFSQYFLCLKEDWLDMDSVMVSGYPKKMRIVIYNTPNPKIGYYGLDNGEVFDTKLMLPHMLAEEVPSVFYFSAVHFKDKMLGYSVLQRTLKEPKKINLVYRNWLRNINNSLEMIQAKNRLLQLSISDQMTGAYNRRGMYVMLDKMLKEAKEGDSLFAAVVDMDGLKYVNDTFGHSEGDFGIKLIHKAITSITGMDEICVRAGGDEFYILGVGKYDEAELKQREKDFHSYLEQKSKTINKPYVVTASIGMAVAPIGGDFNADSVINKADVRMYKSKVERKKQRV